MKREEALHLLEHWIEHNESHSKSFRDRARQVEEISKKAALDITKAADLMDQCTEQLKKAREEL